MTYFAHNYLERSASPAVRAFAAVRQNIHRDLVWNRHVFKAPALASPHIAIDPLPFKAVRVTQRSAQR